MAGYEIKAGTFSIEVQDDDGAWRKIEERPLLQPRKTSVRCRIEMDGASYITMMKIWAESLNR